MRVAIPLTYREGNTHAYGELTITEHYRDNEVALAHDNGEPFIAVNLTELKRALSVFEEKGESR